MFPLFQKYLNSQARANRLVNSVVYHTFPSRMTSRIHSFIFLKTLWGFISLKNACWTFSNLHILPCAEKKISVYGAHIPRKLIESIHFYLCPSPPLKNPGRKGWRKLWFALSKFNQKIRRWPGTLVYLYFACFVIFLNVMALQFCEEYLSNSVVLSLLSLICNHGNLTLKLHQKK